MSVGRVVPLLSASGIDIVEPERGRDTKEAKNKSIAITR